MDDFLQSKSGKLQSYLENEDKMLYEAFTRSPDMQMLLNLLAAKEGIWSSILILCLFDKCYKNEFKASTRFNPIQLVYIMKITFSIIDSRFTDKIFSQCQKFQASRCHSSLEWTKSCKISWATFSIRTLDVCFGNWSSLGQGVSWWNHNDASMFQRWNLQFQCCEKNITIGLQFEWNWDVSCLYQIICNFQFLTKSFTS